VFGVSTGARAGDRLESMVVAHAAAVCLARAVARGVHAARAAAGNLLPCWSEMGV
jgi:D-aminopeptidase